jgi:endonuclease/exonuclease/phosphatase family metal-dependent hydrolase
VSHFTLTTFNAHWGRSADGTPFDLARTCAGFDTDLVAVQEVWNPTDGTHALDDLRAGGTYEVHEVALSPSFVHPRPEITRDLDLAAGTWGIALLSRLPVRSVRTVELGRIAGRVDVARRVALVAEVEVGRALVTVAATHLSFVPPNAAVQLFRLRRHLPPGRPTVVAGDCNLWGPVAAGVVGLRRAVRGRTYPADRPHSQLDHVLLSGHIQAVAGTVLPAAGSDHLPVQARLHVEA